MIQNINESLSLANLIKQCPLDLSLGQIDAIANMEIAPENMFVRTKSKHKCGVLSHLIFGNLVYDIETKYKLSHLYSRFPFQLKVVSVDDFIDYCTLIDNNYKLDFKYAVSLLNPVVFGDRQRKPVFKDCQQLILTISIENAYDEDYQNISSNLVVLPQ